MLNLETTMKNNFQRNEYIFRDIIKANIGIPASSTRTIKKHTLYYWPIALLIFVSGFSLIFLFNYMNTVRSKHSPHSLQHVFSDPLNMKTALLDREKKDLIMSQYHAFLSLTGISLKDIFGLKIKTIMIDPGHGGNDPGAIGALNTKEKDITLDIALKLKDRLSEYPDIQVIMTRQDDQTICLKDRVEIAKNQAADLFISIHVNFLPLKREINIIETFYFGPTKDSLLLELAHQENEGSTYTLNDFKGILQNMEDKLKTEESRNLAYFIQKSLFKYMKKENLENKDYGIKTAPFTVLLANQVPAVLCEVSCLSNIPEENKLRNPQYRENIAKYLEQGIVNYLQIKTIKK
jgi:N-acetylmuramoyl-L-alanine amidase